MRVVEVVAVGALLVGTFSCVHAPKTHKADEDEDVRRAKTVSTKLLLDHYASIGARSLFVAPGVKWPLRLVDNVGTR